VMARRRSSQNGVGNAFQRSDGRLAVPYLRLPIIGHPRTGVKPRTDGPLWERACRGGGQRGKESTEQWNEAAA
jgi:hypothetical protein